MSLMKCRTTQDVPRKRCILGSGAGCGIQFRVEAVLIPHKLSAPQNTTSSWIFIIVHSHLFSSLPKKKPTLFSSPSTTSSCIVYAINKDTSSSSSSSSSQQQQQQKQYDYIIDKDKAREALQNLDQQLETLSQKQVPPPKIRASEVKLGGLDNMGDEMPDYSGSFLPYMTATLLAFSIFYNILFYKVIKPSIDFPVEPVFTAAQTSPQPVSQNQFQDAT